MELQNLGPPSRSAFSQDVQGHVCAVKCERNGRQGYPRARDWPVESSHSLIQDSFLSCLLLVLLCKFSGFCSSSLSSVGVKGRALPVLGEMVLLAHRAGSDKTSVFAS